MAKPKETKAHEKAVEFVKMKAMTTSEDKPQFKLKRFQKLKKLIFSDNNVHSFIQISKLEVLTTLNSLTIENNEVSSTVLVRTFIVYRFPNVTEINGSFVSD
jgi:hypothetical protein